LSGVVHSVNISSEGGVPKIPVSSANVMKDGLEGDFNRFRAENREGDPRRAVSIFSLEKIRGLMAEGHPVEVGSTGENITIEGIDWESLEVGMRIRVGDALLELSEPCAPCSKIGGSFVERRFARIDHDLEAGWSRWLATVLEEGAVSIDDSVDIVISPN
tara:strand:- start:21 stop:500 length:480 start_codon:yes stop_codon:yes gene_type:complete